MNIDRFREIIRERNRISADGQDEWSYGIEQCWKQEVEILSEDVKSTIAFLKEECTDDEYSWISEVIDDLAEKTQSKELIQCYKALMDKFPEECKKYNIAGSIEFAEAALEEGDSGE